MRIQYGFLNISLVLITSLVSPLLMAAPIFGATVVEGYVTDQSGRPVPDLLVICDSPRSAVRTDEFGYFIFPVSPQPGERLFHAYGSHRGGKLVSIPQVSDDPLDEEAHVNASFEVRRCPSGRPCNVSVSGQISRLVLSHASDASPQSALIGALAGKSPYSGFGYLGFGVGSAVGTGLGTLPSSSPTTGPLLAGTVRVHYATDRQRDSSAPGVFSSLRSDPATLTLGTIDVTIPRDHRLARVERPTFFTLSTTEQKDRHFTIVERTVKEPSAFYTELAERIRASQNGQAFVFIHGYNVSFDDAIYRTAQISYDLAFDGPAISYSWPSNGAVLDYTQDLNNSEWSIGQLTAFLRSLVAHSQAKDIHLIAHSMGNRVLVGAIQRLMIESAPRAPTFSQVVLTAPDIDAGVFRQLADAVKASAFHVTLYASSTDRALRASKRINGYPRAGDAGAGIVVLPGLDTVDVSSVNSDLLGHGYYGDNRTILSDMFNLLRGQPPPRFGLREARAGGLTYWRFLP